MEQNPYAYSTYTVKKQIFKMLGGAFRIYDPSGNLAFYAQRKSFAMREDIRLFSDESMREEVLTIKARSILGFASAYDVIDPKTNEKVGVLKRMALKSMLRDEWVIMNSAEQEFGFVREDSMLLSMLRRMVTNLIPQTYHGEVRGMQVLTFKQNFNPFALRLSLDFTADSAQMLDRRLGIAAAVLLCAIEGRQR